MKVLLLPILILSSTLMSYGQSKFKEQIESQRIAYITQQLELSPEESAQFWPVYNAYQNERKELMGPRDRRKKRTSLELSEAEAELQLESMIQTQQKQLSLKLKLIEDLKSVLPSSKIIKLDQADREFKQKLLKKIAGKRNKNQEKSTKNDSGNGN